MFRSMFRVPEGKSPQIDSVTFQPPLAKGPMTRQTGPMQAFLDDHPLSTDRPTLAAALRAASHEAKRHGRIVVEVFVDGQQAADDLLERPPDEPMSGEVRLVSVDPRSLVRETLQDCVQALETANQEQLRCAEFIQSGRTEDALSPLSHAVETWQAVRDALERGSALLLGSASLDASLLGNLLEALAVRLEEIRSALAREDWSALADVLAYDMPEQVERWKSALGELADRLV